MIDARIEELKKRVLNFWIENNDAMPQEWRSVLVQSFITELEEDGFTKRDLEKREIKHPQLIKKATLMRHDTFEILADFIMDIDMIEERQAEYPVLNTEAEHYQEKRSREKVRSIIFDEQLPNDPEVPLPPYSIREDSFNTENPVEEAVFNDAAPLDTEDLRQLIRDVKETVAECVKKYADGSAWNAKDTKKRRTPDNVYLAIISLDEAKIKRCEECGCGFYSRDARQVVCDVMLHPKYKKMTFCAYERNKRKTLENKGNQAI